MITKLKQQVESHIINNVDYATLTFKFDHESLNCTVMLMPQQLLANHFVSFVNLENCTSIELLIYFKDQTQQLITHPNVSDWLL